MIPNKQFGGINLIYLPLSNFYPFLEIFLIFLHFFNSVNSFFNLSAKVVGLLASLQRAAFLILLWKEGLLGEVTARIYWFLSLAVSGLRLGVGWGGEGGSLRRYGTRFGVTSL